MMWVFPFKSTCVPTGMYSFICSCGGDGAGGLETFLLLKLKTRNSDSVITKGSSFFCVGDERKASLA